MAVRGAILGGQGPRTEIPIGYRNNTDLLLSPVLVSWA